MRIVTIGQMKALEQEADSRGMSYRQMMMNAGREIARAVISIFPETENRVVLGLVGSGNNGGDTLVALNELMDQGWKAVAFLTKPRSREDEWFQCFESKNGLVIQAESDSDFAGLEEWLQKAEVLLDGVLGTGMHLPLDPMLADVLFKATSFSNRPYTIAVDCPSGVDCESGQVVLGCIPADLTICLEAVKIGLLKFPAFKFVGEIKVVSIKLPGNLPTWEKIQDQAVDLSLIRSWMPPRALDAHKGSFGTALIAAGSRNYPGAVLLAGRAAYRTGVGLLRIAIPSSIQSTLAGHLPEATWLPVSEMDGAFSSDSAEFLLKNIERTNSLLIGPGWGKGVSVFKLLQHLLKADTLPKLVIDADGLRHLIKIAQWYRHLPEGSVLTPHPGEMSALTGLDVALIQADRMETARKFAVQWGYVVILKGALTVVASPQGQVMVIPIATPALARAGTGDVLAGMVVSLIAQGMDSFHAAAAAAWLHARAGQLAADELGTAVSVMASDVIECIPQAIALLD